MKRVSAFAAEVVSRKWFRNVIIILVGFETYASLAGPHKEILHVIDYLIVWCFVAVCLLPVADTQYVAVLRVARILRMLRMISYLPKLRLLIGALLKSIPSMGYVIQLLSLLFYICDILGSFMFGKGDPAHFGNLQAYLEQDTLFTT